jgi:UTP--glucose-1-phosphate uridylyltransferase
MKISTAVITAAGFGSRFLPFVKNVSKEMVPIVDKPSIHLLVDECVDAGIERIFIVVRKGNHLIQDYFFKPAGDVEELLVKQGKQDRFDSVQDVLDIRGIHVIFQDDNLPYGNGSPVYSAKPYLRADEPFVLLFGDDMFLSNNEKGGVKQLMEYYEKHQNGTDAVLAGYELPREEIFKYSSVKFKEYNEQEKEGVMEYQIEKPTEDEISTNILTYGRMVLTYKIFDYLKPDATGKDGELWLQDANSRLAENGCVRVKILDGLWITTGDPGQYLKALIYYYLRDAKYGEQTKKFLKNLVLD